jgi:hypothetical protein
MNGRTLVSTRRFRQLPHAADIIVQGDPPVRRWQFVYSALGAILSSTTPGGRYLMLRNGFPSFQLASMVSFDQLSTMKFDATELRALFDGIEEYVQRKEAHMIPGFALLYERERASFSSDVPDVNAEDAPKPDKAEFQVEKVVDGSMRRVS